jgi:hypothetical protein
MIETTSKKERLERRRKKAEKMIFAIGITAVVFVVATYAWFIGTTQVLVNSFTLSVKSGDGLSISLTGDPGSFSNEVTISQEILEELLTTEYTEEAGNRNYWDDYGLVPVSTVGQIDKEGSDIIMYNKTSVSSLTGGYRLRADVLSHEQDDRRGYVAFDLFLKNTSGDGYTDGYNFAEEEGIYLLHDSFAHLVIAGAGGEEEGAEGGEDPEEPAVPLGGDGIENSVRVAFVQLGRVSKDATKALVQGITCNEGESPTVGVTGLCDEHPETIGEETYTNGLGFTWNIWEPNHTQHNDLSKAHLDLICRVRSEESTYTSDLCVDDWDSAGYLTTYAIKNTIESSFNVNIYDGLNGYNGSSAYLQAMDYFTDEDKMAGDPDELFYLAPNSVTKLRVYIYLEGQDIDNYDLGTYGKDIEIMFGFTKDKYSMSLDDGEPEINS